MSTPPTVKAVLRVIGGLTVAGLVLSGGYSTAAQLARTSQTQHLDIDAQGIQSVLARTDVGDVRVEEGAPGADSVEVTVDQSGSWRLPVFEHRTVGGELVLDGTCPDGWLSNCSTDLVVRVPADLRVRVHTSVGDVTASGRIEELSMDSSTGDLRANDLDTKSVTAVSSVGDVRLQLARPPEQVSVTSSVGDVRVVVPSDGTSYDVSVQTDVGDHRTTVPVDTSSPRRIRVTTSVGDVVVTDRETP